jgi:hypothetical protein
MVFFNICNDFNLISATLHHPFCGLYNDFLDLFCFGVMHIHKIYHCFVGCKLYNVQRAADKVWWKVTKNCGSS